MMEIVISKQKDPSLVAAKKIYAAALTFAFLHRGQTTLPSAQRLAAKYSFSESRVGKSGRSKRCITPLYTP